MNQEIFYSKIKSSVEQFNTPQFLFFEDKLRNRILHLKEIFQKQYNNIKIYYSYKTNYLPEVCKIMHSEGIGAEVSNLYDINLALSYKNKNILFNGPAKTIQELNLAIKNNKRVIINLDNLSELKKIIKLNKNKKDLNISARLRYKSRFGIDKNEFKKIISLVKKNKINLIGLHIHTKSEQNNSYLFLKSIDIIAETIKVLDRKSRQNLKFINLGGGFGVDGYLPLTRLDQYKRTLNIMHPSLVSILNKKKLNFKKNRLINDVFAEEVVSYFNEKVLTISNIGNLDLIFEPGRWLVNPTFYFLTSVLCRKNKKSITLDASITHGFQQDLRHFKVFNISQPDKKIQIENMYGCSLLKNDFLGARYQGKQAREGDVFLFKDVGAYTIVHASNFKRPLPEIIRIKDGKIEKLHRLIK